MRINCLAGSAERSFEPAATIFTSHSTVKVPVIESPPRASGSETV